ncbi:hypothetical protein [Streptomyces werraensis]|uniref:hypothetical protein n=1 Tax=Streptomyces werraensis TaxID=68284 RepID=UPI0034372994
MAVRLYNPATGRFLSADPVPGGSCNAYDYRKRYVFTCEVVAWYGRGKQKIPATRGTRYHGRVPRRVRGAGPRSSCTGRAVRARRRRIVVTVKGVRPYVVFVYAAWWVLVTAVLWVIGELVDQQAGLAACAASAVLVVVIGEAGDRVRRWRDARRDRR